MRAYDIAVGILFDLGTLVASIAVSIAGLRTELLGLQHVATGDIVVGAWFAIMGGVALFVGVYLLGYREVLPRVRRRFTAEP